MKIISKFSLEKLFSFSWKKLWIIVVSWFVSVILHNIVSGLFGIEEAFFFIIAIFIIPIYVVIFIVYNLIRLIRK
jgi:hypothetical protein